VSTTPYGAVRRIFVVGYPRSGTTLVQGLLAAHDALTSFTESHFFWKHFTRAPWLPTTLNADPAGRVRAFLAENGEAPTPASAWFESGGRASLRVSPLRPLRTTRVARQLLLVLDELALRRGRPGWVEKTPMHLYFVPFIERVSRPGPGVRFVHVIRDWLEAAASLHAASRTWERHYTLEQCASRWNGDVALSLRRAGSPADHFVFYEDLVARPDAELRRLLAALDLPWQADLLERHARGAPRLATALEPWKATGGAPGIRASGAPARALTGGQRDRLARLLRQETYAELHRLAGGPPRRAGRAW
jgi:hypothetical protein